MVFRSADFSWASRGVRRSLVLLLGVVSLSVGAAGPAVAALDPSALEVRLLLAGVDRVTRVRLENLVRMGRIATWEDLVRAARDGAGTDRGGQASFAEAIARKVAPLLSLERDSYGATLAERSGTGQGALFSRGPKGLPAAYETTLALTRRFDPRPGTSEHGELRKAIEAYLRGLSSDPSIRYALACTGTSLEDLQRNWFGRGRGFEHVLAGELTSRGDVGGFHWWYRFYAEEREGRVTYERSLEPALGDGLFTGRFRWDPDGSGPLPAGLKRRGSFLMGCPPQVLLAVGHIALETSRPAPGKRPRDVEFVSGGCSWCLTVDGDSIRSLYPRVR